MSRQILGLALSVGLSSDTASRRLNECMHISVSNHITQVEMGKILKAFAILVIGFWGWFLSTTNATVVDYASVIGPLSAWGVIYLWWKSPSDGWRSIFSDGSTSTTNKTSSDTPAGSDPSREQRDFERDFSQPLTDEQKVRDVWEEHLKDGYDELPSRNAYEEMVCKADDWHNSDRKEEFIIRHRTRKEDTIEISLSNSVDSLDDLPKAEYYNDSEKEASIESIEKVDCRVCSGTGLYCTSCNNSNQVQCTDSNCKNGIIKIKCDNCNLQNQITESCTVCDGSGYSVEQQCNKCGGSGEHYDREGELMVCRVCDGGVFREQCGSCNGDGEVKQDCPKCDGDGSIRQEQCNTCGQYPNTDDGMIPCNLCDGGDNRPDCSNCEGQGLFKQVTVSRYSEEVGDKKRILSSEIPFSPLSSHAQFQTVTTSEFDSVGELRENRNSTMADKEPLPDDLTDSMDGEVTTIQYTYSETQTISTYRYKHTDAVREYDRNIDKKYGLKSQYGALSDSGSVVSVTVDGSTDVVLKSSDTSGLAHADAI